MSTKSDKYQAGFVGLIGMPNSGKSTLVNAIVGEKISIVTARPQTTRKRLLGIHTEENAQMIFVDAPGVVKSTSGLNTFLEFEYKKVVEESDVLIAVLSTDEKAPDSVRRVLNIVRNSNKPWICVITKADLGFKDRIGYIKAEAISDINAEPVLVSAVEDADRTREIVVSALKAILPLAPGPLYDEDLITTDNLRDMAAEVVREKCFEELSEEIPYGLAVQVRKFDEVEGRPTVIVADILVEKASHKPMVIGKGGAKIKEIGTKARQDIEKMIDNRVFLETHVVVKEQWTKNKSILKDLGYVAQE